MESGNDSFIETKQKIKKCLTKNYTYKLTHDVSLDFSPVSDQKDRSLKASPLVGDMRDKTGHGVKQESSITDERRQATHAHMEVAASDGSCSVKRRKRKVSRKLPALPQPKKENVLGLSLADELERSFSRNNCPSESSSPENVPPSPLPADRSGLNIGSLLHHLGEMEEDFEVQTPDVIDRHLSDSLKLKFDTTSQTHKAFLSSNNPYLREDSSPEELPIKREDTRNSVRTSGYLTESSSSNTINSDSNLFPTHRAAHRFIPRHEDEVAMEIGDPIYVDLEADDLWCEGMNLRTGQRGIFPAVYATDLKFLEEDNIVKDDGHLKPAIFVLRFLGSVEVHHHRGTDVLVQAMNKVVMTRRMSLNTSVAPLCTVEINELGIKMIDRTKVPKVKSENGPATTGKIAQRLMKILALSKSGQTCCNHFFSLKNVSFCGSHPKNPKYFGFITKHPTEMRFAAHIFVGEQSTKNVGEAVGHAFQRFYAEYMAFQHPTEDIYLE